MAWITGGQTIPAEWLEDYKSALTPMVDGKVVRRRYPWRLPHMQNANPDVSAAQLAQRGIFDASCNCYRVQPLSGGATPPAEGPRNRSYWYTTAAGSGLWYYNYFMQTSIDTYLGGSTPLWCRSSIVDDTYVYNLQPDTNFKNETGLYALVDGASEYRTFIKNPYPLFDYVQLTPVTWYACGTGLNYVIVEVYEIDDPWDVNTITWNNKPPLGRLLSERTLVVGSGNYKMYLGKGVVSYCVLRSGGFCGVRWASAQYADATKRPYSTS